MNVIITTETAGSVGAQAGIHPGHYDCPFIIFLTEIKNEARTSSVLDKPSLSYCGQHTIAFYVKLVVALGGFVFQILVDNLKNLIHLFLPAWSESCN